MRRVSIRLAVVLGWALGAGAAPSYAQSPDDSPKTVTIAGQHYTPYRAEELRARGLDVPDVPFDENAAWVYIEAINALTKAPEDLREAHDLAMDGKWPDGEQGERLAEWLEGNRAAMDAARRASAMDRFCMPLLRGDQDRLLSALLPQLSLQRDLAKAMRIQATYLASHGKAEEALETCLTMQRMAHHIGNGLTLIEGLVGVSISSLADQGMRQTLESAELSPEGLRATVAEMERLAMTAPTFEQMVRAEQRWAGSFIDDSFELKPNADDGMQMPGVFTVGNDSTGGWNRLFVRLKKLYLPDRAMKRHLDRHYEALIEATKHEDGSVGMTLDEDQLFAQIPAWDVAAKLLLPSLARAHEIVLRNDSNFVRTRLALAAEAYRLDHGRLPPTLSALVPDYIASVPLDPITGYDFEYAARAAGGGEQSSGLALITRDSEEELRKKRRTPKILNPRESKWRRFVREYADRYQFTEAQRTSAESILRDIEAKAVAHERQHGAKISDLVEADGASATADRESPLGKLFVELEKRLDTLPTAKQRLTVKKARRNRAEKGASR